MERLNFYFWGNPVSETGSQKLSDIFAYAKKKAKTENALIGIQINDMIVIVAKDSGVKLLIRDQKRSQFGLIKNKIVGPYPEKILHGEEQLKLDRYLQKKR